MTKEIQISDPRRPKFNTVPADVNLEFWKLFKGLHVDRWMIDRELGWLHEHYAAKNRFYHDWRHIVEGLEFLDANYGDIDRYNEVVCAYIYHDVIYRHPQGNDERRSARCAYHFLQYIQRTHDAENWYVDPYKVERLILGTIDHQAKDNASAWLLDADLIRLASPHFDEFSDMIRLEFSDIPDEIYHPARKKILSGFLEHESIFSVEANIKKFEELARSNIAGAIL